MTIVADGFGDRSHDEIAGLLDVLLQKKSAGLAAWALASLNALYGIKPVPSFDELSDPELTVLLEVLVHWLDVAERYPAFLPAAAMDWLGERWVAAEEALDARIEADAARRDAAAVEAAADAAAPFRGAPAGGVIDGDGAFIPDSID